MSGVPTRMMIGIQPTGWTNDDFPEIGNETPYQTILEQTAAAGFEGGSTGHNYPAHLPSLLSAMGACNLKIASTWAGTTFTAASGVDVAFAAFEAQVAFLKAVAATDVVVAELANAVNQIRTKSVLTERPILNEPQWRLLAASMNKAGKYAHDEGMQLSYHPHVGTGVMTIDETARLLDATDPEYVGLCLDTAHLRYGGASPADIADLTRQYKTRITHVHLKNVRAGVLATAVRDAYSFYEAILAGIFTVPGDPAGEIDLAEILRILQEAGFGGWMVVEAEQNPAQANPLKYATMARDFLRTHLGY